MLIFGCGYKSFNSYSMISMHPSMGIAPALESRHTIYNMRNLCFTDPDFQFHPIKPQIHKNSMYAIINLVAMPGWPLRTSDPIPRRSLWSFPTLSPAAGFVRRRWCSDSPEPSFLWNKCVGSSCMMYHFRQIVSPIAVDLCLLFSNNF